MRKQPEDETPKKREKAKRATSSSHDFEPKDQSRWIALLFLGLFLLVGYFFWVQ